MRILMAMAIWLIFNNWTILEIYQNETRGPHAVRLVGNGATLRPLSQVRLWAPRRS